MSRGYAQRCRHAADRGSAELLGAWLATIPATGWSGTAADLSAALGEFALTYPRRPTPYVPADRGVSRALERFTPTIAAAGWRVEFSRTASTRSIRFTRSAAPAG